MHGNRLSGLGESDSMASWYYEIKKSSAFSLLLSNLSSASEILSSSKPRSSSSPNRIKCSIICVKKREGSGKFNPIMLCVGCIYKLTLLSSFPNFSVILATCSSGKPIELMLRAKFRDEFDNLLYVGFASNEFT